MAKKIIKQKVRDKAVRQANENAQFAKGINNILGEAGLEHDFKKYGKIAKRNSANKRIRKFEAKHGVFQEQKNKPKKGIQILAE